MTSDKLNYNKHGYPCLADVLSHRIVPGLQVMDSLEWRGVVTKVWTKDEKRWMIIRWLDGEESKHSEVTSRIFAVPGTPDPNDPDPWNTNGSKAR
jgi:hypothetical protein